MASKPYFIRIDLMEGKRIIDRKIGPEIVQTDNIFDDYVNAWQSAVDIATRQHDFLKAERDRETANDRLKRERLIEVEHWLQSMGIGRKQIDQTLKKLQATNMDTPQWKVFDLLSRKADE